MADVAIIYYTSNKEDPKFEKRVQDNILSVTDLPIISVSQKPIDFGENVCVGDVGASGFNCFRQVQMALKNTDADFVISAEADCLYPPDYFEFRPPNKECWRNDNLYIMGDYRKYFWHKKEGSVLGQVVGKQYYLDRLNLLFEGAPAWSVEEFNFPKERHRKADIFNKVNFWTSDNPIVSMKTHRGMRYHTHTERINIHDIPYWGNGKELRKAFCG
jgi:hypothetical protein